MIVKGRVAQRLEHVATNYGVGGSNPPLPKTFFIFLKDSLFLKLGCRQVVRQQTLTLSFVGSSPPIPAYKIKKRMSVEIQFIKGKRNQSSNY